MSKMDRRVRVPTSSTIFTDYSIGYIYHNHTHHVHVFFRPNQSEAVFLQFGDLALFDGETITGYWPAFAPSA